MTALSRNMDDLPGEGTVDLREFLATIARRKRLVLTVTIALTTLAALYSYSRTPVYTAKAAILVRPILTNPLESIPLERLSLQTEIRIATSAAVADVARDLLDSRDSLTTLLRNVSVSAPQDAQILEFSYSHTDTREAQRGAQAFADAYLEFKAAQAVESIARHASTLQAETDKLDEDIRGLNAEIADLLEGSPEWEDLVDQRRAVEATRLALQNQLATVSTLSVDAGQVIQPAELPASPSRPNHRIDLLLGVLIGLIAGVGSASMSERLRDRIESQASFEHILEAPVLGVIPKTSAGRKSGRPATIDEPKSLAAESFRTLRTNLLAVSARPPVKTLLVTSAGMGEGKSTISANLAVALAQMGKDVVLISADLRFPRVHSFFGLGNDRGLGQVLSGEVTLDEALCDSIVPQLRVLPSGPVAGVAEPVELIQSDKMLDVIARCAEIGFVILDGSPILAVADSLVIATMVDAVLFVADSRNGRRGAIAQSRHQLRQVDARVVGGVLNGVDEWRGTRGGSYGPYDYRRGLLYRILVSDPRSGRSAEEPLGRDLQRQRSD